MREISTALASVLFFSIFVPSAYAQPQAKADLKNADGKSVGMATLREIKGGVLLTVEAKELSLGLHAIHIHEVGKCEEPQFTSAGGHFNPTKVKHGLKSPEGGHGGDMPNLYVTKEGIARYQTLNDRITLGSGDMSVFDADGSTLVIHAIADDDTTAPAGNAGERIACGVITKDMPRKK